MESFASIVVTLYMESYFMWIIYKYTIDVLLDNQTRGLDVRRQLLRVYRHQQGSRLILSYLPLKSLLLL